MAWMPVRRTFSVADVPSPATSTRTVSPSSTIVTLPVQVWHVRVAAPEHGAAFWLFVQSSWKDDAEPDDAEPDDAEAAEAAEAAVVALTGRAVATARRVPVASVAMAVGRLRSEPMLAPPYAVVVGWRSVVGPSCLRWFSGRSDIQGPAGPALDGLAQ